MSDQANFEKIKERIRALLAMAADTSSPHEAAIAAGRARRLMDTHQINSVDVVGGTPLAFGATAATRVYAALPAWMDFLSVAVCKFNDCQSVFDFGPMSHRMSAKANTGLNTKTYGKYIIFRGYESDVALAVEMYKMLIASIDRLCKEFLKDKGYEKYPVKIGSDFKEAASRVLCARLGEMTAERETLSYTGVQSASGTALVVATKRKAVDEQYGEFKTTMKHGRVLDESDRDSVKAAAAGAIAGRKIEILKTVE